MLFYIHMFYILDGHIPRDSTYITFAELSIPFTLYITMASLAAIGMLLAVIFFGFNIVYRDNRYY